jgi:hypothetical protein
MPISLGVEGRGLKSFNAVPVTGTAMTPAEQVSVLYWLHGIAYLRARQAIKRCQPRVKL